MFCKLCNKLNKLFFFYKDQHDKLCDISSHLNSNQEINDLTYHMTNNLYKKQTYFPISFTVKCFFIKRILRDDTFEMIWFLFQAKFSLWLRMELYLVQTKQKAKIKLLFEGRLEYAGNDVAFFNIFYLECFVKRVNWSLLNLV